MCCYCAGTQIYLCGGNQPFLRTFATCIFTGGLYLAQAFFLGRLAFCAPCSPGHCSSLYLLIQLSERDGKSGIKWVLKERRRKRSGVVIDIFSFSLSLSASNRFYYFFSLLADSFFSLPSLPWYKCVYLFISDGFNCSKHNWPTFPCLEKSPGKGNTDLRIK